MFLLGLSMLLYKETGSALYIAYALSSEYIINIIMLFFAGSIVDRKDPKTIMVKLDLLRGISLLLASVIYMFTNNIFVLYIALVILNIIKPFYRSAHFALTPSIVEKENILHVNALKGAASQSGALIGTALAAPIFTYLRPEWTLIIDGISFILCGLIISFIKGETIDIVTDKNPILKKFYVDWKEMINLLKHFPSLLLHLILCSGDFLFVSLSNLTLIPLNESIGGNPYILSLIDGSFAIGSLSISLIVSRLAKATGNKKAVWLGYGIQIASFIIMAVSKSPTIIIIASLVFGIGNTISMSVFMGSLQTRSIGKNKGRIGSLRQILLSTFGTIFLPFFGDFMNKNNIQNAILLSAALIVGYLLLFLISDYLFKPQGVLENENVKAN